MSQTNHTFFNSFSFFLYFSVQLNNFHRSSSFLTHSSVSILYYCFLLVYFILVIIYFSCFVFLCILQLFANSLLFVSLFFSYAHWAHIIITLELLSAILLISFSFNSFILRFGLVSLFGTYSSVILFCLILYIYVLLGMSVTFPDLGRWPYAGCIS